jgi:hypothetical protein
VSYQRPQYQWTFPLSNTPIVWSPSSAGDELDVLDEFPGDSDAAATKRGMELLRRRIVKYNGAGACEVGAWRKLETAEINLFAEHVAKIEEKRLESIAKESGSPLADS